MGLLAGRIIPTATWPAYAPTWDNGEPYDHAREAEYGQAIFNALRVLQLGNIDMTDFVAAGDGSGSLLAWAGKITVMSGLAANDYGYRDMVGGAWTTAASRNVADSISVSAVGATSACQSYRANANYDSMEFFNVYAVETGESHPTGNSVFVVANYSAYSGLFLLNYAIGANFYVDSTPGSGATPTWTTRHTWATAGPVDGVLVTDPTGQYVLVTGLNSSYISQDGGVTWTITVTDCHCAATVWDVLNSRWLRAHDTNLAYNTTAGILAGTAWTTVGSAFPANCTSMVALPGGLLLARLTDAAVYYSENSGATWTRLAAGCGALRYSGGYVCTMSAESTYVSRRVGGWDS